MTHRRGWSELKLDLAKKELWCIVTHKADGAGFGAWVGTVGNGAVK